MSTSHACKQMHSHTLTHITHMHTRMHTRIRAKHKHPCPPTKRHKKCVHAHAFTRTHIECTHICTHAHKIQSKHRHAHTCVCSACMHALQTFVRKPGRGQGQGFRCAYQSNLRAPEHKGMSKCAHVHACACMYECVRVCVHALVHVSTKSSSAGNGSVFCLFFQQVYRIQMAKHIQMHAHKMYICAHKSCARNHVHVHAYTQNPHVHTRMHERVNAHNLPGCRSARRPHEHTCMSIHACMQYARAHTKRMQNFCTAPRRNAPHRAALHRIVLHRIA